MLGSAGLFAPSAIAAKPRALQAISTQMELVVPVMSLLRLATAVALAALLAAPAAMAEDAPVKHHSLSLIGEFYLNGKVQITVTAPPANQVNVLQGAM